MIMDTHCLCGWEFPHATVPMNVSLDTIIPNACVGLDCPRCGRSHAFYVETSAKIAPLDVQQALGLKPKD